MAESVLRQNRPVAKAERVQTKLETYFDARLWNPVSLPTDLDRTPIIRPRHEGENGFGQPHVSPGSETLPGTRIVAIGLVYGPMVKDHPGHRAPDVGHAMNYLAPSSSTALARRSLGVVANALALLAGHDSETLSEQGVLPAEAPSDASASPSADGLPEQPSIEGQQPERC